jgi:hypothetical protein
MSTPKSELATNTSCNCLVSAAQDWTAYSGLRGIRNYLFVCSNALNNLVPYHFLRMTFSRTEEKCVEYRKISECGHDCSYQHLASSGEMPRWYVGVVTAARVFAKFTRLPHSPSVIPHPPKYISLAANGRNATVYPWYCLSFSPHILSYNLPQLPSQDKRYYVLYSVLQSSARWPCPHV